MQVSISDDNPSSNEKHELIHCCKRLIKKMLVESFVRILGDVLDYRWLNGCPLHNNMSNTVFSFPSGDVDQLGFPQCKAGPRSSRPRFNPGDVLFLNLVNVFFCSPTNAPTEVVVNVGRRPAEKVHWLIHEV